MSKQVVKSASASVKITYSEVGISFGHPYTFNPTPSTLSIRIDGLVTYGDNLKNWRRLIATGLDATTTLTADVATIQPGSLNGSFHTYVVPVGSYGQNDEATGRAQGAGFLIPSDPGSGGGIDVTSADNAAKFHFTQKGISVTQKFQGGIFLGELRETLHMIRQPAKAFREGLSRYFISVKKLRRIRNRKLLGRAVTDTWLEFAFGWRPLVSDIDAGAKALADLQASDPSFERITGRGSSFVDRGSLPVGASNGGLSWTYRPARFDKATVIYRGAIGVTPSKSKLLDPAYLGFDPVSWVPTVWELIPYSFLVDYFTNIGDVINAWAFQRGSLRWCNRTIVREAVRSNKELNYISFKQIGSDFGGYKTFTQQSITCPLMNGPDGPHFGETRRRFIQRASFSGSLIPNFQFEVPGVGTKWINIGALAVSHTLLRGRSKPPPGAKPNTRGLPPRWVEQNASREFS